MGLADSKNTPRKKIKKSTLKTPSLLFFSEGLTLTWCGKMMRGVGVRLGLSTFPPRREQGAVWSCCLSHTCQSLSSLSKGQPRSALSLLLDAERVFLCPTSSQYSSSGGALLLPEPPGLCSSQRLNQGISRLS